MVRRTLALAAPFLPAVLALAVTGCQGTVGSAKGPWKNTYREAVPTDFRSMDPAIAFDSSSIPFLRLVCQNLLDYDDDAHLVPLLAEEMPALSEDRTTYTFKVRKGILFSNGRELTAHDFVYTWDRVLDPKLTSPCAQYLTGIVGAKEVLDGQAVHAAGLSAPDDYTLVVKLVDPDPTFLNITAMLACAAIPKEEVDRWKDDFFRHPVGTGPYVLKEWRRNVRLRFEPNPIYSLPDKAKLDAVEVTIGPDASTSQWMFERGELDIKEGIPPADYPRIRKDPHWQPYLSSTVENATYYLSMNCEMEPFTDRRVRQAFCYAINKDRLSKITNGRCIPTECLLPPNLPGYNPEHKAHPRFPYDPEKAKKLLAEAGHSSDLSVTIMTYSEGVLPHAAESVQQDLKEVGVKADINQLTASTVFKEIGKPKNVALSLSGWGMDYPDPSDFVAVLYQGPPMHDGVRKWSKENNNNVSFFDDPRVNKIIEEAAGEADLKKRYRLYQDAEDIIIEEAPTAFLFNPTTYRLHQPWVHGERWDPVWLIRYDRLSLGNP